MEELLNKLIEKGWRIENENARIGDVKYMYGLRELWIVYQTDRRDEVRRYPIRFLSSIDSGLWQFVCENGMIKEEHKHERILDPTFGEGWADCKRQEHDGNYEYRLIESALCDEDKLEDFILDNVKIEG